MAKKPVAKPKAPSASAKVREKLGIKDGPAPGEKAPQMRRPKKQAAVESRTDGTATGGDELADLPVDGVPLDESVTGDSAANDARAKLEANRGAIDSAVAAETGTARPERKLTAPGAMDKAMQKLTPEKLEKYVRQRRLAGLSTTTVIEAAAQRGIFLPDDPRNPQRKATTPAAKNKGGSKGQAATTTATPAPKASAMDMGALAATALPNSGQLVGPAPMDMSKLAAAANNAGQPTPAQVPTNQNVMDPNRQSGLLPAKPEPVPSLLDRTLGKTYVGKAAMFTVPELLTAAGLGVGAAGLYRLGKSMFSGEQTVPDAVQQQAQAARDIDFSKPMEQQMQMPNPADQMNDPANTIRRFQQPQKPMIFPQESF
jgi:hypothetical protein